MTGIQLGLFEEEPLPCYKCGGKPELQKMKERSIFIYCGKCRSQGMSDETTREKMIHYWNMCQVSGKMTSEKE